MFIAIETLESHLKTQLSCWLSHWTVAHTSGLCTLIVWPSHIVCVIRNYRHSLYILVNLDCPNCICVQYLDSNQPFYGCNASQQCLWIAQTAFLGNIIDCQGSLFKGSTSFLSRAMDHDWEACSHYKRMCMNICRSWQLIFVALSVDWSHSIWEHE